MHSNFRDSIDRICSYAALTSFEKLLIIFLINKEWLFLDKFAFLPKKKIIASKLNADPSAVSRGLKKAKHLRIISENEEGETIFNIGPWAENVCGLYLGEKIYEEAED